MLGEGAITTAALPFRPHTLPGLLQRARLLADKDGAVARWREQAAVFPGVLRANLLRGFVPVLQEHARELVAAAERGLGARVFLFHMLAAVRPNVVGERRCTGAGTELRYAVFRSGSGEWGACWDADGTAYIPEELLRQDERRADLVALHEHVEYRHRAAGRPHAYAHRRAYPEELLAAEQLLGEPAELDRYVRWRVGPYPSWTVPDPDALADSLLSVLNAPRPRRGELFRLIAEPRI